MTGRQASPPAARFAAGDDSAASAIVAETLCPTFDFAYHVFADADRAGIVAREACTDLLAKLRKGPLRAPELLAETAAYVVARARTEGVSAFSKPFAFEDAALLGCAPTDRRLPALAAAPAEVRQALAASVAMDLDGPALGYAIGVSASEADALLARGLSLVPSDAPLTRLRDLMDDRAARVRIPRGTEEAILEPFEI